MHLDAVRRRAARCYEDLQRIHDAAADLPALDAARSRVAADRRTAAPGRTHPRRRDGAALGRRPYVGVARHAAALVLAVGSARDAAHAARPRRRRRRRSATPPAAAPATDRARPSKARRTPSNAAQEQFEKAIADLEKVAKANQQALDPGTSATIEKNLGIIDQAIAENRAAVKSEPTSVAARETLFEALRQKVSLLQDTISLINEMRKGNNAAAAQLVNKS